MSWLARSIADSLRVDDDDEDKINAKPNPKQPQHSENEDEEEEDDRANRGVREDLSEFTETLSRQLWGVASFLAPPPPPPPPPPRYGIHRAIVDRDRWRPADHSYDSDGDASDSVGISNQWSYQVVSETWERDSNFLPFEREGPSREAVGVTEEVLAFAMNIAHHPETWLDFPLEEEDDVDGFDMSDAQREHVLAIQHLAPWLAALRIELCPAHMSEEYFWKVYFVLLHSRLNKQDAEVLFTRQIMAARALWMQELQKRTKKETYWFGKDTSHVKESANSWQESFDNSSPNGAHENIPLRSFAFEPAPYSPTSEIETEKHPVVSTGVQIVDKSVIEEEPLVKTENKDLVAGPSFKLPVQNYEDDDDDDEWLKEDSELDGYNGTEVVLGNHEDVSFSDLEDDGDCTTPIKSKTVTIGPDMPTKTSRG